jgi:integrase
MAAIYRRGKRYWARAQRKGREYRRSLATTNRAVAERRFREWLEELDAIAYGDKPRRTWEEASERFIREHLPTIKRSAAVRYGVSLKHLDEHFAGKMLHQITSAGMSEFEAKRRAQGVSTSTIRRDLACLSSLLTSAQDWEWIEINPVPDFLRRRAKRGLKEGEARTRYLTEEEERRLLKSASPAVRWAMTLAIDTGLRREELFGLAWAQVDMLRGLIDTTRRTKSGRSRKVPIPPRSAQILAHVPRNLESPHVLVNPDTGERYVQMNKGLKAACRRAGLKDVQWHDLRRTAGCRWLQRDGKSMEEVSLLLGHSSVLVTEKSYAFLDQRNGRRIARRPHKCRHRNSGLKFDSRGTPMRCESRHADSDSVNLGSNPSPPATSSLSLFYIGTSLLGLGRPRKDHGRMLSERTEP